MTDANKTRSCFHTDTDYGFVLFLEEDGGFNIEVYTIAGIGRYELEASGFCDDDDDKDESLKQLEEEYEDEIDLARKVNKALQATHG